MRFSPATVAARSALAHSTGTMIASMPCRSNAPLNASGERTLAIGSPRMK